MDAGIETHGVAQVRLVNDRVISQPHAKLAHRGAVEHHALVDQVHPVVKVHVVDLAIHRQGQRVAPAKALPCASGPWPGPPRRRRCRCSGHPACLVSRQMRRCVVPSE